MATTIKPKIEEFIPLYGLVRYHQRCKKELGDDYEVNSWRDYRLDMGLYHTLVCGTLGSALGTAIGILLQDYWCK